MYFLIENDDLLEKNMMLFRIKSALIQKKNLIASLSYGDEVIDFYDKEIPKVDSNHTC